MSTATIEEIVVEEDLKFVPPCDSRRAKNHDAPAEWAVWYAITHCDCVPLIRLWCDPCLKIAQWQAKEKLPTYCPDCGKWADLPNRILRIEPINSASL
jgi:hypothetical protein